MMDGDAHIIVTHRRVCLFCVKNRERKKLQCIWGRMEAEEKYVAREMCASLNAAMGMPTSNGDESAMVTLF